MGGNGKQVAVGLEERKFVKMAVAPGWGPPPDMSDGFIVKNWVTGPNKGEPRPQQALYRMVEAGLARIEKGGIWSRWYLTEAGHEWVRDLIRNSKVFVGPECERFREAVAGRPGS